MKPTPGLTKLQILKVILFLNCGMGEILFNYYSRKCFFVFLFFCQKKSISTDYFTTESRMINENDKLQEAIVDRKIPVLFGLQAIISFPLLCVDFRLKIHLVNDPPNIPQNTGYIKIWFQFFKIYLSFFFQLITWNFRGGFHSRSI